MKVPQQHAQNKPKWLRATPGQSPAALALCTFAAILSILVLVLRQVASRDPTSIFFQPDEAYATRYSDLRAKQAKDFIADAWDLDSPARLRSNRTRADICVGVPSIARENARYLRTAVGSLLEGLTENERDRIHLLVFIANTDPEAHPAYREPWLAELADEILTYNQLEMDLDRIDRMTLREKGLFDYQYLLNSCYNTGTPYVALVEDDILAADGWLQRTLEGLDEAEEKSIAEQAPNDLLYLRLFYTEEFLGWDGEFIVEHAFWSIMLIIAVAAALITTRTYYPNLRRYITNGVIAAVCLVCLPLLILLFFNAGRVTMFPLHSGVNKMNRDGCCSQGLVFPRDQVRPLVDWLAMAPAREFVDMLIEHYADERGLDRYALTPSVFQHYGKRSSKGDDYGPDSKHNRALAEKIWNFQFELYDGDSLRSAHGEANNDELRSI